MALTTVKSDQIQTSVALAGSPTTTTQSASDNSTKIATTAYADTAVANLVASAPAALNTLDELAAALNDDASFSTTITNSIATKLPLAGGTLTGALNMGSQNITNAGTIAGTLATAAQTNITSLGTLSALTVSGNVGIGNARTDGTLHVLTASAGTVAASTQADDIVIENSAEGGMTIITPDDQSARIRFTSPSTNTAVGGASIFYRQNINKMNIGTEVSGGILALHSGAGSETMRLDSSGNVNIGAKDYHTHQTSVDALQIGYALNLYEDSYNTGTLNYAVWANNSYYSSSGGNKYMRNDQASRIMQYDGNLAFQNAPAGTAEGAVTFTDRLNILANGNVGIGTGVPSSYYAKNLVVMADGDGTGGITIAAPATDDNTYLAFADGTSGAAAYAGYVGYRHASTEYLFFGAGGGTRMYITQDGHVGIGTDSPYDSAWGGNSKQLTVSGTDYGVLNLIDTGGPTRYAIGAGDGKQYLSYDDVNGRHNLTVAADGKVGIGAGNTAPASLLHVDGSNVGSALVTFHQTAGSSSADRGLDVETSSTGTTVQRWLNSGTELARITGSGRMGIGLPGPSRRKLEINDESPGIVFHDSNVTNLTHEIIGGGNAGLEISADYQNVGTGYIRLDIGANNFHKFHEGGSILNRHVNSTQGRHYFVGSVSPWSNGNRYLHVQLSTSGNAMLAVHVFGYSYLCGIIEGMGVGYNYNNANQSVMYDHRENGSVVAMHQNTSNSYSEVVIDTVGTGTSNRFGAIAIYATDDLGQSDKIEIVQYGFNASTARLYT